MKNKTAFYERTEDEREIRIVWSSLPTVILYSVLSLAIVFMILTSKVPKYAPIFAPLSWALILLILIYSIVFFVVTRKASDEMKAAIRKGNIKVQGGRLSFKDPFVCIISKPEAETDGPGAVDAPEPDAPEDDAE